MSILEGLRLAVTGLLGSSSTTDTGGTANTGSANSPSWSSFWSVLLT